LLLLAALACCCQAVTNDLERFKEQLTAAQAAADAAGKKQAAADGAARRAAARQQQARAAASQAVVAVARLLFSCLAVISGAAAVMQQHSRVQPETPAASDGAVVARQSKTSNAAAAAAAVVASGLADMVCLSQDELADLLGCEDETCQLLLAAAPHDDSCAAAAAGSAAADGTAGDVGIGAGPAAQAVQRLMRAQEARYMQQQSLLQRQLEGALAQLGSSSSSVDDLRGSSSTVGAAAKAADLQGSDVWAGQYGGLSCSRSPGEPSDGVKAAVLQPVLAALQLEASAVQGGLQAAVVTAYAH
jgi:hypothetical protein